MCGATSGFYIMASYSKLILNYFIFIYLSSIHQLREVLHTPSVVKCSMTGKQSQFLLVLEMLTFWECKFSQSRHNTGSCGSNLHTLWSCSGLLKPRIRVRVWFRLSGSSLLSENKWGHRMLIVIWLMEDCFLLMKCLMFSSYRGLRPAWQAPWNSYKRPIRMRGCVVFVQALMC